MFFVTDQKTNKPREHWPLQPWADVHLCAVDAGRGPGSHQVVVLRDGSVLDPHRDEPRRMSDYSGFIYMAAIYAVPDVPLISGDRGTNIRAERYVVNQTPRDGLDP